MTRIVFLILILSVFEASAQPQETRDQYFTRVRKDTVLASGGTITSDGRFVGDTELDLTPVRAEIGRMQAFESKRVPAINTPMALSRDGYHVVSVAIKTEAEINIFQGSSTFANGMACTEYEEDGDCEGLKQEGGGQISIGQGLLVEAANAEAASLEYHKLYEESYGGAHAGGPEGPSTYTIFSLLGTHGGIRSIGATDYTRNPDVERNLKLYSYGSDKLRSKESAKKAGMKESAFKNLMAKTKAIGNKVAKMFQLEKVGKILAGIGVGVPGKNDPLKPESAVAAIPPVEEVKPEDTTPKEEPFRGISSADLEGLTKDLGGSPIGIKSDDIFKIIQRRYKACDEANLLKK